MSIESQALIVAIVLAILNYPMALYSGYLIFFKACKVECR